MVHSQQQEQQRRQQPQYHSRRQTCARNDALYYFISIITILVLLQCIRYMDVVPVVQHVQALPSGAAACDEGAASANYGFHVDSESGRIIDKGLLSKFNTSFVLQNRTLPEYKPADGNTSATPSFQFPANRPLNFILRSGRYQNATLPIRGVLVRVQAADDVNFLMFNYSNELLQDAGYVCDASPKNVLGLTHRTRVAKSNITGSIQFDQNGVVLIDITAVYMNGRVAPGDKSIFGFTRYNITIVNASSVPTPNFLPVEAPVSLPPPTKAPIENRCVPNNCRSFLGLVPGTLYNRFRGGRCETKCNVFINFFVLPQFGWQCGDCI